MKIVTFIFSVLILFVTSMPCADAAFQDKELNPTGEIAKQSEQKNHNDSDNCSPFCNCSCCGITITDIFSPEKIIDIPVNLLNYSAIAPNFISTMPRDFWHPPQLG